MSLSFDNDTVSDSSTVRAKRFFEGDSLTVDDVESYEWGDFSIRDAERRATHPHREPHILAYSYWVMGLSQTEIARRYGVSQQVVSYQMETKGIPTIEDPSHHRASIGYTQNAGGDSNHAKAFSAYDGETESVYIHRLLAVAKYGFDAVEGKVVHHTTGHPLDNRPEAIEVMERDDHARLHGDGGSRWVIEDGKPRLRFSDDVNTDDTSDPVEDWWGERDTDDAEE